MKDQSPQPDQNKPEKEEFPGYPHQPDNEDIYRQEKEEVDIDPEDTSHLKQTPSEKNVEAIDRRISKDREMDGSDLDVPGSEADDALENIGSEDEENNYYSLGGDNHNELEETED